MSNLVIPLTLHKGRLARTEKLTEAISDYLTLLVTTHCNIIGPDPGFGFSFNNLKFENVNEKEGIVYNTTKKLSGSSKNLNTYASDLQQTIVRYEPRLQDVKVVMTYVREEKQIYTTVDAVISETQQPYQYSTTIKVWH